MKLKKHLLFYFLLISVSANCQMPISESNSFMYNKLNYGFDLFNVYTPIQQLKDGKIVVWPNQKPYVEIGNISASQFLNNSEINRALTQIIYFKNKQYLISANGFFEILPNRDVRKLNFYNGESIGKCTEYDGKLWFWWHNFQNKKLQLFTYDGKQFSLFYEITNFNADIENVGSFLYQQQLYIYQSFIKENKTQVFQVAGHRLLLMKTYPFNVFSINFKNLDEFNFTKNFESNVLSYNQGKISTIYKTPFGNSYANLQNAVPILENNFLKIISFHNLKPEVLAGISNEPLMATTLYNKETNSYYLGTGNQFYRLFPYIKKYPRVFGGINSQQIFSIVQARDGKIWAGSYNGKLAFIDKDKITESKLKYCYMNACMKVGKKILLSTEFQKGIFLFDDETHYKKIVNSANSYTNFISKDSVFYRSDSYEGINYAPWKEVVKGTAKWKKISKPQGLDWVGIDDFAEDNFGNIWGIKNKAGVFVYQPKKDKAQVWSVDKKQLTFGGVALFADTHQTIWIATNTGNLYCYEGKSEVDLSPKKLHKITHPLLETKQNISFIHQWKNYLIIGASNKILLFDLEKWYKNKMVLVKYLNPMETNFTSDTEQHTILTDFRDESIWFTTSDMLYQWDIKNWLKLPIDKVNPKIIIIKDTIKNIKSENEYSIFQPTENSFNIDVNYQTKDNIPRYINAVLVKNNEKPVFDTPNLETHFKYSNLRSGKYIFYIRVCQQDGSYSMHKYYIEIEMFLWQHWWFWLIISFFPMAFLYYYFRSQKEIETHKKEIAQLNVSTLSNQFRPHFMLNALNSLGTELDDKPHAESVISRIGENINLMYDYSQERKFYIPFQNEWKLVENTIEIQKIIFIKNLEVRISHKEIIPENYLLPMGILQVCVENALLHGIRHRKIAPYLLEICFNENNDYYFVEIIDNGVGRKKSEKIYGFKRKGTGLKNIFSLIKIINTKIPNALILDIKDTIFEDESYPGTKVIIKLQKQINYEKFNF